MAAPAAAVAAAAQPNVTPSYKFKAPYEGTGKDQLTLTQWMPAMKKWLQIMDFWDICEKPEGHAYTAAENAKDSRVSYAIWEHLSTTRRVLISGCVYCADTWRKLEQVIHVYVYGPY